MKKAYGEAAKQHAINLRKISRFTYPEIEAATGIPAGYVRKLMHEENAKEVTLVTPVVTEVHEEVTGRKAEVTEGVTQEKHAENTQKTPILNVTEEKPVTEKGFFHRHFTRMDCVFYTATVTACYSFWHIAPGIPGATFALLYWLLAFDALQRVKAASENAKLAEAASYRVWGLEIFAAVAHWNLIREYLFSNLEKLPFEVKQVPEGGVWVLDYSGEKTNAIWQNGDLVSLVAAILSCSICAAVIVAIDTTFKAKSIK